MTMLDRELFLKNLAYGCETSPLTEADLQLLGCLVDHFLLRNGAIHAEVAYEIARHWREVRSEFLAQPSGPAKRIAAAIAAQAL